MLLIMEPKKPKRSKSRPINRRESLDVYGNMEDKSEMHSNRAYDNIESMYSAFYAGVDPRRRREMAAGGMVKEDRNAMANLSNTPVHREYPPAGYFNQNPYIDDSVEGE